MNLTQYTREFGYNFKLAYPVILGMLGHTLVAFADNVMVGQLGTAELAAVSLGNSMVFVAMSFGIGFSTAITPLVAEADGAGDTRRVKSVVKHGLLLCGILSLFLYSLLYFAEPLMRITHQPKEVIELASPFTQLVAFSLIPLVLFQALKQFADGLSLTRYSMYVTILGNLLNVFLNYLFIFGNFGCPKLGIIGVGIGTLVSRILMVILMFVLLRVMQRTRVYVTNFQWRVIQKKIVHKLLSLGSPSGMQVIFEVGIFTAAIWLSGVLGKNPQAANQIALNLSSMTFMVASGLGVTAMIRVGNQKGLKDYVNLRRIAISVFLLVLVLQTVFALLFSIFRNWLPTLYLDENDMAHQIDNLEVITQAGKLLLIAAIFQISDGIQVAVLGALRGLQDVKIPMLITFFAYWIVGFPLSYYLGLHTPLGGMGIWIGLLVGLTVAAIWLSIRFNRYTLKLIRK